jgi:flagellum-specific ATP synthase
MSSVPEAPRPHTGSLLARLAAVEPLLFEGQVTQVVGTVIEAEVPGAALGTVCEIETSRGGTLLAEVVGFRGACNLLMPFDEILGVGHGSKVRPVRREDTVAVGPELLGRVLGPLGQPIDGKGPIASSQRARLYREAPDPLGRARISEQLGTGVRALDTMLSLGKGQRIGIMAGSGVGKSTLLGMVARNVQSDVNVIALIGERGREVREFIEEILGEEGMARSVVVAVTGDASPILRVKGSLVATTIAESFRDAGLDVMLMMDSVTRLAMAQREIGLAAGEPPTARGYTPSVFAMLPRILERCGNSDRGSMTGIYTVLVEGDDMNDPIADATRGILDGHIVLTRDLASRNHFPAIDVLKSTSRVMKEVVSPEQVADAGALREVLATFNDAEELVNIGAYRAGSNPLIDKALTLIAPLRLFLRQGIDEVAQPDDSLLSLAELAMAARATDEEVSDDQ